MKIGLIAGGGALPHHVVRAAFLSGRAIEIITVRPFAKPADYPPGTQAFGLAEFGHMTQFFKKRQCTHVCFAGYIDRPNFRDLKPDFKAIGKLPGAVRAAKRGDTALLNYVMEAFEDEGFKIIAPQRLCVDLLLSEGHLGDVKLTPAHLSDAQKACEIASQMAELQIGQAVVVCRGLVLAVEAQEGTDALLTRIASLPESVRGSALKPEGVLAKMLSPQDHGRVDLPTIGVETVRRAQAAGLAGIVAESGRAFILDKRAVRVAANTANMFVAGLPAAQKVP